MEILRNSNAHQSRKGADYSKMFIVIITKSYNELV
jgi:hypothetical protein